MSTTMGTGVRVVAILVMLGLLAALLAGIAPSALGYESFVVSGYEMLPVLEPGDLVVVQPIRAELLKPGDVVTYRTPDDPTWVVTRRVLSIEPDTTGHLALEARGDAEANAQQVLVAPSARLGRLSYNLPQVGLVVNFANQLWGKLMLVALPVLLLAGDWYRGRGRRRREKVPGLITLGRRAVRAGHPELALRAAEGALAIEPYNRAAWILKQQALKALETSREHVAA